MWMLKEPKSNDKGTAMNERLLLLVLAAVQFTSTLDFLIILPLGPQYMRVFEIGPKQFGLIVSAYAISAGISGIAAGSILDHFDRKTALIGLYLGFAIGTLACALAPNYQMLVAARAVAGAFGGVAGATIMAIVGDVVPEQRRGAAMGLVMSSFSVASICGVPLGLVLAANISWHVPFFALTGLSLIILAVAARVMPSLRGHLHAAQETHPFARTIAVLARTDHQMAFLFMALLTFTGFLIFPNLANYMVMNVGMTEHQLPLIYLVGGLCTFFTMNWIGKWSDRAGKPRVFTYMSVAAMVPILITTNLPHVPLTLAISTSTLLMICMSGRFVPAMAMMTTSIEARYRGGFMSINSSVQQFACGLASFLSGLIMDKDLQGKMTHFPLVGVLSFFCAGTCIYLARYLRAPPNTAPPVECLPVES
jgi:predicted MFS family arabinose efflux permease